MHFFHLIQESTNILEQGYGPANIKSFDLVDEAQLTERGLTKDVDLLLSSGIFPGADQE